MGIIQPIIKHHVDTKNTIELIRIVDKYGMYYDDDNQIFNNLEQIRNTFKNDYVYRPIILRRNNITNFYYYLLKCLINAVEINYTDIRYNFAAYYIIDGLYVYSPNYTQEIPRVIKKFNFPQYTSPTVAIDTIITQLKRRMITKNMDKFTYNGLDMSNAPDILENFQLIKFKNNNTYYDLDVSGILDDGITTILFDCYTKVGYNTWDFVIYAINEYNYGFPGICLFIIRYIVNIDPDKTLRYFEEQFLQKTNITEDDEQNMYKTFMNHSIFDKLPFKNQYINNFIQSRKETIDVFKKSNLFMNDVANIISEYIMY